MKEETLLHLLQKKRGFFEAICDLTESESHLPFREWITVLEQKKILLTCIEDVDGELNGFERRFFILTQEIGEEIDHIRQIVEKILHLDQKNQEARKKELLAIKRIP